MSVCVLATIVSSAKTDEPIEMPFVVWHPGSGGPRQPSLSRFSTRRRTFGNDVGNSLLDVVQSSDLPAADAVGCHIKFSPVKNSHHRRCCPSSQCFYHLLLVRRSLLERKHSWYRFLAYPICRSVCLPVCPCVWPESVLWQNGWLDLDAILGGEWGRARDGCIRWEWLLSKEKGQFKTRKLSYRKDYRAMQQK